MGRAAVHITLLLVACALGQGAPRAEDSEREQLEAFRAEIKAIQKQLNRAREQRSDLEQRLARIEEKMAEQAGLIHDLNGQVSAGRRKLTKLEKQRGTLSKRLGDQQERLSRYVRAAYMAGQQEYLKILLNQEDPALVGRSLAYYDIFSRARAAELTTIRTDLEALGLLEASIRDHTQTQEDRLASLRAANRELEARREERRQVLASLDREISAKDRKLARLREDEQRLQSLVGSLDRFARPDAAKDFFGSKGKLLWPVQGRITARYGTPRSGGNLKWQGLFFKADEGRPVRAVAPGRVIFADWLRGYGFLLIVDHGDGYMSLYGHNQRLDKQVGDRIEAGEVIAGVGASGGRSNPGLYFEIRRNGQPTDPLPWLLAKKR